MPINDSHENPNAHASGNRDNEEKGLISLGGEGPLSEDQLPGVSVKQVNSVERIVAGSPVDVMRAVSQLAGQTLEDEGQLAFFLAHAPGKSWGIGDSVSGISSRFDKVLPPLAVENTMVAVYPGLGDEEFSDPRSPLGWLQVESFGRDQCRIVLSYDRDAGSVYRPRWDQLCEFLDDRGLSEVFLGAQITYATPEPTVSDDRGAELVSVIDELRAGGHVPTRYGRANLTSEGMRKMKPVVRKLDRIDAVEVLVKKKFKQETIAELTDASRSTIKNDISQLKAEGRL